MFNFISKIFSVEVLVRGNILGTQYEIRGPLDEDKDGNPEFVVSYGDAKPLTVELPMAAFLSTIVAFVSSIVGEATKILFGGRKA
jgi:hypothetical protein